MGEGGQGNKRERKEIKSWHGRTREAKAEEEREEGGVGCVARLGEEKRNQWCAHSSLDSSGAPPNFPDMTAAVTLWFWLFTVPRGMAVIPDHAGIPESQCGPTNIPWDRAGLGSVCPCQELWADLPIQQPRRRGCAEACWRLVKGDLCNVLTQPMEAGFQESRSRDTWVPTVTLPR